MKTIVLMTTLLFSLSTLAFNGSFKGEIQVEDSDGDIFTKECQFSFVQNSEKIFIMESNYCLFGYFNFIVLDIKDGQLLKEGKVSGSVTDETIQFNTILDGNESYEFFFKLLYPDLMSLRLNFHYTDSPQYPYHYFGDLELVN